MTTVGIATGAGRGTGLACARRLATMVDALLLVDLDEAAVTSAAADLASAGHQAAAEPFVLDDPLGAGFCDRLRAAVGPALEDSGLAYAWAKLGVHRFVRQEALLLGPAGARICSVSPGIIDTPQGQQEAQSHPVMAELVRQTPLGRSGRPEEVAAAVHDGKR
jgi:NAD(P)-dependent dehydrogenase (short-subunit alcohol dehydrogenase family)